MTKPEDDLAGLCDRAMYGETPDGMKRDELEPAHQRVLDSLAALRAENERLRWDNYRMHLLYEIKPPEQDAVARMFAAEAEVERLREALEQARECCARPEGTCFPVSALTEEPR